MIRGLYTATAGMLVAQKQSETIGENMDNLKNPGYREQYNSVEAFPQMLINRIGNNQGKPDSQEIGVMGTGVIAERSAVKVKPGLVQVTDQNTDIALVSNGFYVVETVDGERYTRNGHFQIDPSGQLRTAGGNLVLGENGPIGPLSPDFKVEFNGRIMDQGKVVDRLRIVDIPGTALLREGKTALYRSTVEPVAVAREEIQMRQGAIEESNVDVNGLLLQMITVSRAYEANQKLIQAQDETLQKAVNEVGKV